MTNLPFFHLTSEKKDAPFIIIIPGTLGPWIGYYQAAQELSKYFEVIIPSLPNPLDHGKARPTIDGLFFFIDWFATFLRDLQKEFPNINGQGLYLIGHSAGADIAWGSLQKVPSQIQIKGICSVCGFIPSLLVPHIHETGWKPWTSLLTLPWVGDLGLSFILGLRSFERKTFEMLFSNATSDQTNGFKKLYQNQFNSSFEVRWRKSRSILGQYRRIQRILKLQNQYTDFYKDRYGHTLRNSIPVLLINGQQDRIISEKYQARVIEKLKELQVPHHSVHLSDIGHHPLIESPYQVVESIVSFFTTQT